MLIEVEKWFAKKVSLPIIMKGEILSKTNKAILFEGSANMESPVSCCMCGRELTNSTSKKLGIGPICAEKHFGVTLESEMELEKQMKNKKFKNWIPISVIVAKEEVKKAEVVKTNSIERKEVTITLKQKKKDKIKRSRNGKCIFISFKYNADVVQKIKSLSIRHYHIDSKEWEVPTRDLNLVMELLQGYNVEIVGKIDNDVEELLSNQIEFSNGIKKDFEFTTKPYTFQKEGFLFGINNNKFLLADQQGLGKTKQALDVGCARSNQFKHCLIVCGVNDLKWNWMKEIRKHTKEEGYILGQYYNTHNDLRIGSVADRVKDLKNIDNIKEYFLITNVETLRNSKIQQELEVLTQNGTIGMSIIDEIHKAKNGTTKQGKAIHSLKTYFKMALTGTPLMNSPLDVYNILKWLDVIKTPYYKFESRYAIKGGYGGYEVVGYKNLNELTETLHKVQLRRLKSEELDLPEKIWQDEFVELNSIENKVYNEVLDNLRENIDKIKLDPNPLAQLIRLRQVTGHGNIVSSKIETSSKMTRMVELIQQSLEDKEKTLVFSNWTQITDRAIKLLRDKNIRVGELTGNIKDKSLVETQFQQQNKFDVLVGTIGVMGTGLTLTEATNVIFLDSPWTYANKEQASDRVHRIGTKSTVTIITLIAKNTIDERIEEIIESKKHYAEQIIEGNIIKQRTGQLIDELLK